MMTLSGWIRARYFRKAVMTWGIHSSMIAWSRLERSSPQRESWFVKLRKSKSLSEATERTWLSPGQAIIINTQSIRIVLQSRVIWSSLKMSSSSRATSWDFLTRFNPQAWLRESSIKLTSQTTIYLSMRLCPLSSYQHWRKRQNGMSNTAPTITCAIIKPPSIWWWSSWTLLTRENNCITQSQPFLTGSHLQSVPLAGEPIEQARALTLTGTSHSHQSVEADRQLVAPLQERSKKWTSRTCLRSSPPATSSAIRAMKAIRPNWQTWTSSWRGVRNICMSVF